MQRDDEADMGLASKEEDPFAQGHSKLYQRRKEIQEELRRQFNLPEEDVLRDVLQGIARPLVFRPPPPVPKPRSHPNQLPRIPRVLSEPPRTKWGNLEATGNLSSRACPPRETEEHLKPRRHSSVDLTSEPDAPQPRERPSRPPPPPGPPPAVPPLPADWKSCADYAGPEKPQSCRPPARPRSATLEEQAAAQLGPASRAGSPAHSFQPPPVVSPACPRPSTPRTPRINVARHPVEKAPHVEKAKELEELARESRQRQRERQEEEQRRAAEREAALASERRADEDAREHRRQMFEQKAQKMKQLEEQHFEEMRERELKRQRQDVEETEKRLTEQLEWERDIRKRFKQEEVMRRQLLEKQMAEEAERQAQAWIAQETERKQSQVDDHEQERERWRKHLQEEADAAAARRQQHNAEAERLKRNAAAEAEAARLRKSAAAEAERLKEKMEEAERLKRIMEEVARLKRNMEQPRFCPATPGRGRRFFRPEAPCAPPSAGAFRERFFGPPSASSSATPSAPPSAPTSAPPSTTAARRPSPGPAAPAPSDKVPASEVLRQAELAAMQQLRALQKLRTQEERHRGFKDLLRAWHPDKNPQNVEVATAVFQRLQAERKKVLS